MERFMIGRDMRMAYFLFAVCLFLSYPLSGAWGQAGSPLTVYELDPFEDVAYPTGQLYSVEEADSIKVFSASNEYESFSIAVKALVELQDVIVRMETLYSSDEAGTILPGRFDVHLILYWYQKGVGWKDIFLVPEIMIKDPSLVSVDVAGKRNTLSFSGLPQESEVLLPVDIAAGETRHFWITGRIDSTLTPGIYRGHCVIEGTNFEERRIPVEWEVLPIKLDSPNKAYGIYYRSRLGEGGSAGDQADEGRYRAELRDMAEHGITQPTMYEQVPSSGVYLSFSYVKQAIGLRKDAGIVNDSLVFLGLPLPYVPEDGSVSAQEILNMRSRAQQAKEFFDRENVKGVFIYGYDEYHDAMLTKAVPVYQAIMSGGMRVAVACYEGYFDLAGSVIGLPILAMTNAGIPSDITRIHAAGKSAWLYSLPQTHWSVISPYVMRSNYGFWLYQSDAQGMAPYCYQHWGSNPWDDFDYTDYADMMITYPSQSEPLPTICWEATREAVDDARYMTTLQNLVTAARNQGLNGEATDEAEEWLRNFTIPYVKYNQVPALTMAPGIGALLENKPDLTVLRRSVADRILAVQHDIILDVGESGRRDEAALPRWFDLGQNSPNPFNGETLITLALRRNAEVNLTIYNILGQHVKTLFKGYKNAGEYRFTWGGADDKGQPVSSGVYFYRATAGDQESVRKMLYMQ